MAIMAMGMVPNKKVFLSFIGLVISTSLVHANEWIIDPKLKLNETYTDNTNFENSDEVSGLVNQVGIGVYSKLLTNNVTLNVEAESIYATYSHDHTLDDNYLSLNGNLNIKLWPNGLSFISSATILNLPRNSNQNAYSDLISGDTVQVENYTGGLEYKINNSKYKFHSNILYNTTLTEDNIGEQEGYSALLDLTNGIGSKFVFWDISNNYQERNNNGRSGRSYQSEIKIGYISPYQFNPFIRYYDENNSGSVGSNRTAESNSYGAGLRWLASKRIIIDLSYNTPVEDELDTIPQDDYFSAALSWNPTIRTSLAASMSQRFYGDSYDFSLKHQTKRLTNTINYVESVNTFTRDNFSIVRQGLFWCPTSDDINFNDCFLSNNEEINSDKYALQQIIDVEINEDDNFSLNKNLSWLSILSLSRSTLTLNISRNERTNLETNVEALQQVATFKISRKVSGYSTIDFSVSYTETHEYIDQPISSESRYRFYEINYNKELNKALSFSIGFSHLNRSSNPTVYDYEENRISFELNKAF